MWAVTASMWDVTSSVSAMQELCGILETEKKTKIRDSAAVEAFQVEAKKRENTLPGVRNILLDFRNTARGLTPFVKSFNTLCTSKGVSTLTNNKSYILCLKSFLRLHQFCTTEMLILFRDHSEIQHTVTCKHFTVI